MSVYVKQKQRQACIYLLIWQLSPANPCWQAQENELMALVHTPPFIHGELAHSLISENNNSINNILILYQVKRQLMDYNPGLYLTLLNTDATLASQDYIAAQVLHSSVSILHSK